MNLQTILLWLNALVFLGFGIACALAPARLAEFTTGAIPASPSALTDMRAVYGGMMMGIGLFLGICARQPTATRFGLLTVLLILICMASTRLLGMLVDGSPNLMMLLYLGAEIVMAALVAVSLYIVETD